MNMSAVSPSRLVDNVAAMFAIRMNMSVISPSSVIASTPSALANTPSAIARVKPEAIHFSIVVPVFNRPDEVSELLASLSAQTVLRGDGGGSGVGSDSVDDGGGSSGSGVGSDNVDDGGGNGSGGGVGSDSVGDGGGSSGSGSGVGSDSVDDGGGGGSGSSRNGSGFEVIIVDDGSTLKCEDICKEYANRLNIKYFFKPNSGRSESRNYGIERATGNYFIIFDSDCVIPPQYIEMVYACLEADYSDCYGGPDNADVSFSDTQKAINYAMTSFFTTGGIRGGKKNGFSPRSFNMGFSREVYKTVGGFKNMIAEDIELSYRIKQAGFRTTLYKEAYVYHKRRVSLKKMFRQVRTFGKGRVMLRKIDRSLLKTVHLLPMAFVLGHILLLGLVAGFAICGTAAASVCGVWWLPLLPIVFYMLLLFVDAAVRNKSVKIGFMAVAASYIQLTGYGAGMMEEFFTRSALKRKQEELYR
jgi:glycosyltransferase involved in cell wall biosynthesis